MVAKLREINKQPSLPWNFITHSFLDPSAFPEGCLKVLFQLSGMFRRSASLALPHLKSFAAIPSVSLVQLGHMNRNVFLSHESQREIDLV